MKPLIRKYKGKTVAMLASGVRLFSPARRSMPSLYGALFAFIGAIYVPLLLLTLTVLAIHYGGDSGLALAAAPILELRAKKSKLVKDANAALTAAQATAKAENRVLTAEELAAQDAFDTQLAAIDQEIELEEKKLARERSLGSAGADRNDRERPVPGSGPQRDARVESMRERSLDDRAKGFASHRDFLMAVLSNSGVRDRAAVEDERLRPLALFDKEDKQAAGEMAFLLPEAFTPAGLSAAAGSDEQGVYDDRYGGFAVAPTFIPRLLEVGAEDDPTAGRTQAIPMQSPTVEIPARTDKNHTTSVVGGLTVTRRPETVSASSSRFEMEKVTMKATGLFGLGFATEEILSDSPLSFVALIANGFRTQFGVHMLNEKIRGGGGPAYLGVLDSPALVTVAAEGGQAADTINAQNVINMRSRCWGYGNAIWIANHDTLPQLIKAALVVSDGAGAGGLVLVYKASLEGDRPDTLLGRPIFYSEYASKLGDVGDIMLVNWSQFLEGLYQPLQSAESVHVRFSNHERAFKFWLRNAGAPWWRSALTPNKSAVTLSPLITLAAR